MKVDDFKDKIDNASDIFKQFIAALKNKKAISEAFLAQVVADKYCKKNAAYLLYASSFYNNQSILRSIINQDNILQYLTQIIQDQTIDDRYKAELIENIISLKDAKLNHELARSKNLFLTEATKYNMPHTLNKLAALHVKQNKNMTLDYKNALEVALNSKFSNAVWVLCKYEKDGSYYAKEYAEKLAKSGDLMGVFAFCQQGWFMQENPHHTKEIKSFLKEMRVFEQEVRSIFNKYSVDNMSADLLLLELETTNPTLNGKLLSDKNLVTVVTKQLNLYKTSEEELASQNYLAKILSKLKIFVFGDRILEFTSKVIASHLATPGFYYEKSYEELLKEKDVEVASLFFNLKEATLNNDITSFKENILKIFALPNLAPDTRDLLSNIAYREISNFVAKNKTEVLKHLSLLQFKDIYKNNPHNAYEDILGIINNSANQHPVVAVTFIIDLLEDSSKKNILKDGKILANIVKNLDNKELVNSIMSLHKQFGIKVDDNLLADSFHNDKYENFSALLSNGIHCSKKLKQEILKSKNEKYITKLASKGVITVKDIKQHNPNLAKKISDQTINNKDLSDKGSEQLSKKEQKISAKKEKIINNKIYRLLDYFIGNTAKLDDRLKAKKLSLTQDKPRSR